MDFDRYKLGRGAMSEIIQNNASVQTELYISHENL